MKKKMHILTAMLLSGVFGDVSAVDAADPGSFAVNDMAGRTFDERCRIGLERQLADTEPSYEGRGDPMRYVFNRCNYALASLFLNRNPARSSRFTMPGHSTVRTGIFLRAGSLLTLTIWKRPV